MTGYTCKTCKFLVVCLTTYVNLHTLVLGEVLAVNPDTNLTTVKAALNIHANYKVPCSTEYESLPTFERCTPKTHSDCGRDINDTAVSFEDASKLLEVAKRGFSHGGSNGSASILDLHCGALSMGNEFVNIFQYLNTSTLEETFSIEDFQLYSNIIDQVHRTIVKKFCVDEEKLYLTHPTFFSRITNASANTRVEEYWHSHVDKTQYPSFDYTSLLYLSDYDIDFTGGRFVFEEPEKLIIEPKMGRLSFFTSGSENPHRVEKVLSGIRYAVTISFTCNPNHAIEYPKLKME